MLDDRDEQGVQVGSLERQVNDGSNHRLSLAGRSFTTGEMESTATTDALSLLALDHRRECPDAAEVLRNHLVHRQCHRKLALDERDQLEDTDRVDQPLIDQILVVTEPLDLPLGEFGDDEPGESVTDTHERRGPLPRPRTIHQLTPRAQARWQPLPGRPHREMVVPGSTDSR